MIAGIQRMIATSGPCFVSKLVAVNMIGIRMNRMSTMYHAVGFSIKLLMRIINTVRSEPYGDDCFCCFFVHILIAYRMWIYFCDVLCILIVLLR